MDLIGIFEKLKGRGRQWYPGAGDNEHQLAYGSDDAPKMPKWPRFSRLWIALLLFFVLFVIVFPALANFLTDLYWYEAIGFESVFWRRFTARWELFLVSVVPAFLIYFLNWRLAFKNGGILYPYEEETYAFRKYAKWAILVSSLLFAFLNAFGAMGAWGAFLKFMNPVSFGETDPLFGIDISFYVFRLPFLDFLQSWLRGVLIVSLLGTVFIYFKTRALLFGGGTFIVQSKAKLHLTLLAALFLLLWGLGYWLDRYELLFSATGVVFGAGYTDMHVLLPALNIMCVSAIVAVLLLFLNFFKPMWRLSVVVIGALLVLGWLTRSFVPSLVQQYRVKPNEFELEKQYIEYHLDYTRRGYGLDQVTTISVMPEESVTAQELLAEQETVQNIRLWDYEPLLRTYKQLQAIRTYYDFPDVFIDRYTMNGRNRQVMLSVRELDLSQLQNPTWVNSHLEFTHGYGVVMNPVNEVAPGGLPNFFMQDLPTRSIVDVELDRPEIYYGTKEDSYVLVKTAVKEFDYPMGDSNVRTSYEGDGGVAIGSMWKRLLFALRYRDSEILFTGALNEESCILYQRNVRAAIAEVTPFLALDEDIYPILYNGRILWAQDCFTWSHRYPYSKPFTTADQSLRRFTGINYLRNSVKVTVDAYTGEMRYYVVDESDPLVVSWRKIFPGLFVAGEEMPRDLWKHMRYPENLFEVQTEIFRTFHMTDANTYYNREDVWEVTPANRSRRIQPNYVTMKLWGESDPEFAIIVPYMPLGRDNLIGWMAGRCDPENYGELLVYEFPKQKLIYGPGQIEALIDQNPDISAQLSLWGQRGSDVIRGDLLVVPVGKSLLYVQPLYLKAERGELPELKRVIVSTGGRVAWAETFAEALEILVGQKVLGVEQPADVDVVERQERPSNTDEKSAVSTDAVTLSALAKRALALYDSAQDAQRRGDWAAYGERIKELGLVLTELEERTN